MRTRAPAASPVKRLFSTRRWTRKPPGDRTQSTTSPRPRKGLAGYTAMSRTRGLALNFAVQLHPDVEQLAQPGVHNDI